MHGFNKRDHRMAGRGALYSLALLLNEAEFQQSSQEVWRSHPQRNQIDGQAG